MRPRALIVALVAAVLVFGGSAGGTTNPPELSAAASLIAGRQVRAVCYLPGEPEDPYDVFGAWGYVWLDDRSQIHLAAEVCDGALAVAEHDESVPTWQRAIGVLVIAHEAMHANNWPLYANEAWTECWAIKNFRRTAKALGASAAEVDELWPYGLAFHFRQGVIFPQYNLAKCKVPWFYGPDGPRPSP